MTHQFSAWQASKEKLMQLIGKLVKEIERLHEAMGSSPDWMALDCEEVESMIWPKPIPDDYKLAVVSIGRAAERAGVHPNTVRRWIDNGQVRSGRTPGGHRRVIYKDIVAIADAPRAEEKPEPTQDIPPSHKAVTRAHRPLGSQKDISPLGCLESVADDFETDDLGLDD